MDNKELNNSKVFIIILNNNRKKDTIQCLSSVERNIYNNYVVILLNTVSSNDISDIAHEKYPNIQIINLKSNCGYSGNNNEGIKAAIAQGAEWILLLNEDTIFDPECISRLVEIGESQPNIGIVGPMVYHYDEPKVIQSAGGILDNLFLTSHIGQNEEDLGQYTEPRYVDWLSGCAILIKRDVIEDIGMLDERFFCYWEETDLCIRARNKGWDIIHVPKAKLWHKGVQRNYSPSPSVTYYFTRNRFLFLSKHHADFNSWLYAGWQTLRTLISWTVRPKWRSKKKHRDAMWNGIWDFLNKRWGKMPE